VDGLCARAGETRHAASARAALLRRAMVLRRYCLGLVRGIDDLCAWGGLLERGGEAIGAGEEEIVSV
jgi:hypothetical protein